MTFSFFQFFKKTEPKTKVPVQEIPLFATLGPAELELIESKIRRVEYKKGDVVYRIGEKAEAFYLILLGRFRVVGARGDTLTILSQGDYFGESSILLGRPHSATVEAKSDGLVFKIEKKDFQELLKEIPSLSLHLSRTLGHRLTAGTTRSEVSRTKVISMCEFGAGLEKKIFTHNLAVFLSSKGKKVVVLGLESHGNIRFPGALKHKLSLADVYGKSSEDLQNLIQAAAGGYYFLYVSNGNNGEKSDANILSLLGFLMDRYDFVFLDLPPEFKDIGVKALQQSDQLYFLVKEENRGSSKVQAFLKEFGTSFGFTPDEIRLVLCEHKEGISTTLPSAANFKDLTTVPVFCVLPYDQSVYMETCDPFFVVKNPESSYTKAIRFLGRELMGRLVGLVLGSGAAFGFAHIGVLRVFEREHIPIDIIAGSSIGSLIGAMWASGINSDQLEHICAELDQKKTFFKLIGFRDFALPHRGFFKGDQVARFLRHYMGRKTFKDLNIPVKIVTSSLFTGEEIVFDEGDVVDAVRASISIPGIFRAVRWKGQFLMDGGVVDPLPVKVVSRFGVKKIIAVNVLSASEDHVQRYEVYQTRKRRAEEDLKKENFLRRAWASLGMYFQRRFETNIFNVLMNTIQFLEYGIAESSEAGADVVIHPVLFDSHWAEFYSAKKFIKRGEEKTLEKLAEIKKLVEETS